jgi:hypothetical protein
MVELADGLHRFERVFEDFTTMVVRLSPEAIREPILDEWSPVSVAAHVAGRVHRMTQAVAFVLSDIDAAELDKPLSDEERNQLCVSSSSGYGPKDILRVLTITFENLQEIGEIVTADRQEGATLLRGMLNVETLHLRGHTDELRAALRQGRGAGASVSSVPATGRSVGVVALKAAPQPHALAAGGRWVNRIAHDGGATFLRELYMRCSAANIRLGAWLNGSCEVLRVEKEVLELGFYHAFHMQKVDGESRPLVEQMASGMLGRKVRLKVRLVEK